MKPFTLSTLMGDILSPISYMRWNHSTAFSISSKDFTYVNANKLYKEYIPLNSILDINNIVNKLSTLIVDSIANAGKVFDMGEDDAQAVEYLLADVPEDNREIVRVMLEHFDSKDKFSISMLDEMSIHYILSLKNFSTLKKSTSNGGYLRKSNMDASLRELTEYARKPSFFRAGTSAYKVGNYEMCQILSGTYSPSEATPAVITKFVLVTRPEFATSIITSSILNQPLNPEWFEFWVDEKTRLPLETKKLVREGLAKCRELLKDTGIPEVYMRGKDIDTLLYPSLDEFSPRKLEEMLQKYEKEIIKELKEDALARAPKEEPSHVPVMGTLQPPIFSDTTYLGPA